MKVLHVPFTYFPDPSGGTEVYVSGLTTELSAHGVESVIAAPAHEPAGPGEYHHAGVLVRRYALGPAPSDLSALYGAGVPGSAEALCAIVRAERPDIVHLHAYSPAVNGRVAEAVRDAGVPLVVTYHTPAVSCQRGTLLRFGTHPCDGEVVVARCSACVLQHNGVPRPAAKALSRLPSRFGRLVASHELIGGVWTALRMTRLMELRQADTRAYLGAATVIVAVASWVRDVLVRNGVSAHRIALIRQGVGVHGVAPMSVDSISRTALGPLRAIFVGRLDPTKGIHTLLAALRLTPELHLTLDILGSGGDDQYSTAIRRAAAADSRVRVLPPVAPEEVIGRMAMYDVTVVPSRVLETGPLVVLESFAARVPVIGSALGGIAELVRDGIDGHLVGEPTVAAWREALAAAASDKDLVAKWRAGIVPPRTMLDVASEMYSVYCAVMRNERVLRLS